VPILVPFNLPRTRNQLAAICRELGAEGPVLWCAKEARNPVSNGASCTLQVEFSSICINTGGGTRTPTPVTRNWILNPARLPIPPLRLSSLN
jgi:hypothetical protein